MKITSTYSVRLRNFNLVFDDTVEVYRHAVDYFIELVMANWNTHFANLSHANDCIRVAESLSVRTIKRPMTPYNFCHDFEKFPSYLRRVAIKAAYGQVSSYQTRLVQWKGFDGRVVHIDDEDLLRGPWRRKKFLKNSLPLSSSSSGISRSNRQSVEQEASTLPTAAR